MIHAAYPNVDPDKMVFIGCGRFAVFRPEEQPEDYRLVSQDPSEDEMVNVTRAAAILAPESDNPGYLIYETQDQPDREYFGYSLQLAHLLARIHCSRLFCKGFSESDIWCTGRIELDGKTPLLLPVFASQFPVKLAAFLSQNHDRLFIVPAANIDDQSVRTRFKFEQRDDVNVASLQDLRKTDFSAQKIILKIRTDELPALVELLFEPPQELKQEIGLNPYRGLSAFREEDADLFFGRETYIDWLVQAVRSKPFVAVTGASGSGKSSLVYAGLIPRLRAQGPWKVIDFRPGGRFASERDPFLPLALAIWKALNAELDEFERLDKAILLVEKLRKGEYTLPVALGTLHEKYPEASLLLFADQFEELYTTCPDPEEQRRFLEEQHRFLDMLLQIRGMHTSVCKLIITLRADFMGKALSYGPFVDALQDNELKLGPMQREELRQAIEQPSARQNVRLEEGLTERILEAVGAKPGELSLVQFTLDELWKRQEPATFGKAARLTHAAYEKIGGVDQALSGYAERVYAGLSPDEQQRTQHIFTQLVQPGAGTEDTKRIATRTEIGAENWFLVARLASERLVVTGREPGIAGILPAACSQKESRQAAGDPDDLSDTVEVVHEALIRSWQRLREWIDADREFRMWQERLRSAMRQWQASSYDDGALLRGALLAEAEQWLQARRLVQEEEQRFIETSLELRDREQWEREVQQQRELQLAHKSRLNEIDALNQASDALWLAHDELGALLANVKAGLKVKHTDVPDTLKFQTIAGLSEHLANIHERNRFQVYANFGHNMAFSPDGRQLATGWDLASWFQVHTNIVHSVAFSPDGRQLASGGGDGTVKLWDLSSGRKLRTLMGHISAVLSVSFSPNGRRLASGGGDGTIKFWDVTSGRELQTLGGHSGLVWNVAFSPDGQQIASGSSDHTIKLWDVDSGRELRTLVGHTGLVWNVAFSPDGQQIASGSEDGTIKVWDVNTGQELRTLMGHTCPVESVSSSPNNRQFVFDTGYSRIKFWEVVASGELFRLSKGNTYGVLSVTFSLDSKQLASGNGDGTVKLWEVTSGRELGILAGHTGPIESMIFSPESMQLVSGSGDNTIRLWDVVSRKELGILTGHTDTVCSVAFSPDGTQIASGSEDSTIRLWDVGSKQELRTLMEHTSPIGSVTFSPDGMQLASGNGDGTIKLWEVNSKRESRILVGHTDFVWSVVFSPDGMQIASGSGDGTVKLWDVTSGREIRTLEGHTGAVISVNFSPNGQYIAYGGEWSTIKLWEVTSGQELQSLEGHTFIVYSLAFSPDSTLLAASGLDSMIRLWEVARGREFRSLKGHTGLVESMAFSPNGTLLASGSGDGLVKLWDIASGQELRTLMGHISAVLSVTFSPNGKLLASGSRDCAIKLWEVASGQEFRSLTGHTGPVESVVFSPDGQQLASSSWDRTIRLWNLDLDQLLVLGCEWLYDYLRNPNADIRDRDWVQNECKQILRNEPLGTRIARQSRREFESWMRWGRIHTAQGRYEQAIKAYQQALALRPDLAAGWLNMAKTHESFGHADRAIESYHRAVELKPGSKDDWHTLMYSLYNRGRLDEAQTIYRELLEIDPSHKFAEAIMKDVGNNFWTKNQLKEAATVYATVLYENPNSLDFLVDDAELALIQCDILRCAQRLAIAMPSVKVYSKEFLILPFLAWLAKPQLGFDIVLMAIEQHKSNSGNFWDFAWNFSHAVVTAIERCGSVVESFWNFSRLEPVIARQDEATQQRARAFIAFFEGEIDLSELKTRLQGSEN